MKKYFDAFLYIANWGTHELMLRVPSALLPAKLVKPYCTASAGAVHASGKHTIVTFSSEDEGGDFVDEPEGMLAALVPLRNELASGDLRALYLAWLSGVQTGELEDEDPSPPCPAGLAALTPAQESFADFLRLDPDLIAAAATHSPNLASSGTRVELRRWITALPHAEKTTLLVRLAEGDHPHLGAELQRRFRESRPALHETMARPTVGELRDAGEMARTRGRSRRRASA